MEEYFNGTRHEKIQVATEIREAMARKGTRFVSQNERGIYAVVDETAAMDKIEHYFRNRKSSLPSKSKNSTNVQ